METELSVKKAGRKDLVRAESDHLEASSILSCGRRFGLWNVAISGLLSLVGPFYVWAGDRSVGRNCFSTIFFFYFLYLTFKKKLLLLLFFKKCMHHACDITYFKYPTIIMVLINDNSTVINEQ